MRVSQRKANLNDFGVSSNSNLSQVKRCGVLTVGNHRTDNLDKDGRAQRIAWFVAGEHIDGIASTASFAINFGNDSLIIGIFTDN